MAIDLLDENIIKLLAQNATESNEVLAKKLGVTLGVIQRRKKALINDGVIRIVAIVNPRKMGHPVAVIVGYNIDRKKIDETMKFLANIPEVVWASFTAGRFDIISAMRFRSNDDLNEFLTNKMVEVDGLIDSETFICLHEGILNFSLMYTRDI